MALGRLQIESLALVPAPGGEATAECPFCGAKKGHFYVNPTKGVYYCHKCGASGRLDDGLPRTLRRFKETAPPVKTAPADRLDAVYRVLLDALALSADHLKHLLTVRGMTEEQVKANGYRTVPHGRRLQIADRVSARVSPLGVPGFYRLAETWSLAGLPGLLIPVRDFQGRIVGCQIRTFEPGLPKYVWLSSNGKDSGAKAATRFHVAYGSQDLRTVWLTEGPLKADVAAPRLGKLVVAVPGVNTLKPALAKELRDRGCRSVVLAFDSDALTKPEVAAALERAGKTLRDKGLRVQVATWAPKYKGIDDLLLAGGRPTLTTVRRTSMNRVFISGYVKKCVVEDAQDTGKPRKITVLIDDPESAPIPVSAYSGAAEALERQNPEPGDWIEGEGRVRPSAGRYGDIMISVALSSARVLKKVRLAWWESEPEQASSAAAPPPEPG